MMLKCQNCGKEFPASRYHPYCGVKCGKLSALQALEDPEVQAAMVKAAKTKEDIRMRSERYRWNGAGD